MTLARRFPGIGLVLGWLVATRLVLAVIGVVSRRLLEPFLGQAHRFVDSQNLWLDIWAVWDSGWYLAIARGSYGPRAADGALPQSYAYSPLYPVLMHFIGRLTGGPLIAGIIISNVCLLISGVLLYRLARLDLDEPGAVRAVQYLFLFPTAFVLSGVFTESLYLMLLLAAFLLARRGRWLGAGLAGFFLAMTRPLGVLVLLPLGLEYARQIEYRPARVRAGVLALLLIPIGLGLVMWLNAYLTGDPLAHLHVQTAWNHRTVNPLASLARGLASADLGVQFGALTSVVCLVLVVLAARRLPASYTVLALVSLIVPLVAASEPWHLTSMPRYALAVFPIPLALAGWTGRSGVHALLAALLALLQGFLMVFWANGFNTVV